MQLCHPLLGISGGIVHTAPITGKSLDSMDEIGSIATGTALYILGFIRKEIRVFTLFAANARRDRVQQDVRQY